MKNLTIKKNKSDNSSYIVNFAGKAKELLKDSNPFVKALVFEAAKNIIYNQKKEHLQIITTEQNQQWIEESIKMSAEIKKQLNPSLQEEVNKLESYWKNWGEENNGVFVPVRKEYLDFAEVIKDMNESFESYFND